MSSKKLTRKEVVKKSDRFRITKDFTTPFEGTVEPQWWYYLEFNAALFTRKKDWRFLKCSSDYSEIEDIYNKLIS